MSVQAFASASISAAACPLDCAGIPNGLGVLDSCGVCNSSNSCVDCAGIPNGTGVLDQCSVCNGDCSSCLGCNQLDNTTKLFSMDGGAFLQKRQVQLAVARIVKSRRANAKVKRAARKALVEANKLYVASWTLTWSISQLSTVCTNLTLCVNADRSPVLNSYSANVERLRVLGDKLWRQAARLDRRSYRGQLIKVEREFQTNIKTLSEIPRSESLCSLG